MRRLVLAIVLLLTMGCWAEDSINVPPYSLSILNVVVRPNETHLNVAKGLYLKGGYVLTAFHVWEKGADSMRWLSTSEMPMWRSQGIVDDKPMDFSLLKSTDAPPGRFTEYFGGFGSTDLSAGDGVYYFV
ncbi:MAG TPA: hypothetical protein VGO93_30145, partial [Candidatus Xenobia bacterium]